MKKHLSPLAAVIMAALMVLSACASNTDKSDSPKPAAESKPAKSNNPLNISDTVFATMMEKSVVNKGNNYRVKKFLEKVRSGEQVYVACIGGSVTEGAGPADFRDGYAYQFSKAIRNTYSPARSLTIFPRLLTKK